jgi:hypothetical protein
MSGEMIFFVSLCMFAFFVCWRFGQNPNGGNNDK